MIKRKVMIIVVACFLTMSMCACTSGNDVKEIEKTFVSESAQSLDD